ncbi:unnamed protein product [Cladocopium goreaui]|uniref:Interferon-induced guanylate-binding protein 1 n=1 Tax=Cladocopium goreaui TaxID=2562237 RepID=A0A9P1GD32_9DINO|nr:unnamed protein product [Cladocopium goreaui]
MNHGGTRESRESREASSSHIGPTIPDEAEPNGGASTDHISEENEPYDYSVERDDEWFQRDLTKQPSPVKTMHLRPGVAVKDLYTGESRSSDMQKYEGQMSRQEYMAFMGFEIPEIHEEASTVIAQEARTQGEFNRVDEIRSQFQELSLLYPPVRLALPSRRPQSAPTRPRISIPQRKDKASGGTIIANKELLQKYFGSGD